MHLRIILIAALAFSAAACSQQGKKPRLRESAVVGTWRSDTLPVAGSPGRMYQLSMTAAGMAELVSEDIGKSPIAERGTWDGADSLVRVVVRGVNTASRPTSMLLAIRGDQLGLVQFDSTEWGSNGLTLYRRRDSTRTVKP
ncbi:MAG: hypothetical protein H7305_15035 [Gemmatimonadaceae bacterium]|nr:hypothetical protein [Gemmatimonadaceae bacterium]